MAADRNNPYHAPRHWTLAQVLESRTDRSGGPDACWPWQRHVNRKKSGYGRFTRDGVNVLAHRAAWEIANAATIAAHERVLHKCDNTLCCNPAHLWKGTQADNVADMHAKARARKTPSRGSANGAAKLTEDDVRKIRADNRALREIGVDYGVGPSHISLIKTGKIWTHVENGPRPPRALPALVRRVLEAEGTYAEIARRLGLSKSGVWGIRNGKTWARSRSDFLARINERREA